MAKVNEACSRKKQMITFGSVRDYLIFILDERFPKTVSARKPGMAEKERSNCTQRGIVIKKFYQNMG